MEDDLKTKLDQIEKKIDILAKSMNEVLEVLDLIQDAHIREINDINQLIEKYEKNIDIPPDPPSKGGIK